jgi:hypothetical protein
MTVLRKFLQGVKTNHSHTGVREKTGSPCFLKFLLFFGILSLVVNFPHSAFSQSQDPLLQKLDSHYYYPSQLGLKKLTAKIKWLQKDLRASQPKFVSHPDVVFYWDIQSRQRIFQVDPLLKGITETQREKTKKFFLNYREVILPRMLNQTLSGFKFNGAKKSPSQTMAEYQSPQKQDEVQKYILEINSEFWRIPKINIERKSPPYRVTSHFKYIQKEGKWLISETLSRFDLGKKSYSEKTSYTYQTFSGYWLPVEINQIFKKGQEDVHSYRFLINKYQIN